MSKGFHHSSVGYWQTTTDNPDTSAYPAGTVEVPIKPSANMDWDPVAGQWVAVAEDLSEVRERVVAAIKAERDRRTQTGGYQVGTKWFHSDTFSRTQQMGLVMLGGNIPSGTQWKTMDGSFVAMDQTLAEQIFAAAVAKDIAIFAVAEAHRTAMQASADPSAYDFSGGWPVIYQPEN